MVRSRWARGAALLTLLVAIAMPARADRDLVGVTQAKFTWTPASGPVIAYRIYVERNGGGFLPHATTPTKPENDRVVAVTGSYGDVIRVQVAAISSFDTPEGPRSDPSERSASSRRRLRPRCRLRRRLRLRRRCRCRRRPTPAPVPTPAPTRLRRRLRLPTAGSDADSDACADSAARSDADAGTARDADPATAGDVARLRRRRSGRPAAPRGRQRQPADVDDGRERSQRERARGRAAGHLGDRRQRRLQRRWPRRPALAQRHDECGRPAAARGRRDRGRRSGRAGAPSDLGAGRLRRLRRQRPRRRPAAERGWRAPPDLVHERARDRVAHDPARSLLPEVAGGGVTDFSGDRRADILWYSSLKQRARVSQLDSRFQIYKDVRLFESRRWATSSPPATPTETGCRTSWSARATPVACRSGSPRSTRAGPASLPRAPSTTRRSSRAEARATVWPASRCRAAAISTAMIAWTWWCATRTPATCGSGSSTRRWSRTR